MKSSWSAFSRPHNPAAKCLHLVRLNTVTSRSELVVATGLSQPTVTRAIAALMSAGYVNERMDLTKSQGRGRPIIPLELAELTPVFAGISVGTTATYIALFDIKGRTIRDADVDLPVADVSQDDFIQHIMAGLNRLMADLDRPLATVGVTTSGAVSPDGVVNAPNLGWHDVNIGDQLNEQFSVPVTVSSAVAAIIGSEIQSGDIIGDAPIMAIFADDSIGAAVTEDKRVLPIAVDRGDLTTHGLLDSIEHGHSLIDAVQLSHTHPPIRSALDRRAEDLGEVAAQLMEAHGASTLVVAGSAFLDDPKAPAVFARTVRQTLPGGADASLRMIPTHREMVRDIARAVALDLVLREPLAVTLP
ncbi:ROK family transcriptional regulator [Corynebacterium urinipleomorphum]|uniref:ROK family transcriptional regulator n=1 Tax=Corynebacterium urinipleomorphum TaxID=1852380 RepID=UPI000B356540|nr:ROK family transcriptional regulator [Corynebacterium urinipleomorphum]